MNSFLQDICKDITKTGNSLAGLAAAILPLSGTVKDQRLFVSNSETLLWILFVKTKQSRCCGLFIHTPMQAFIGQIQPSFLKYML